jgi:hypothetical protein
VVETTVAPGECAHLTAGRGGRLRTVARWGTVAILAWSAGGKLVFPQAFGDMLAALGLLPDALVPMLQHRLPYLELLLALSLATRIAMVPALLLCFFLGLVFSAVHVVILVSGTAVPCGCIGVSFSHASWPNHMLLLLASGFIAAASQVLLSGGMPRRSH